MGFGPEEQQIWIATERNTPKNKRRRRKNDKGEDEEGEREEKMKGKKEEREEKKHMFEHLLVISIQRETW